MSVQTRQFRNRLAAPRASQQRQKHAVLRRSNLRVCVARANAEEEAPVEFRDELGELSEKIDVLVESCDEQMKGTSIFLVGMMGSGKSTVGQCLANVLRYCFFDTDSVVEQAAEGKTVAQIFEEEGEEGFRDLESNVLQELSAYKSLVVATGGGAVKRHQNWGALQAGITVYLEGEPELLAKRIHSQDGAASRPLLADENGTESEEATMDRLRGILAERKDVYKNADCTVQLDGDGEFGAGAPEMTYRILSAIDQRIKESAESRRQYQKVDIQYASGKENINVV